jgi:uncharacterized protein (TIGR00255 family)
MKSMTGYGRGESAEGGFKITVELSSVNRKQAEISAWLPHELEPLEPLVRDEVNRRIARGRVTVRIALHASQSTAERQLRLDVSLAKAYARELHRLVKELKLDGGVTLEALLRAPGVLQTDDPPEDPERFWPTTQKALGKALDALIKMRTKEGRHLADDLKARIALLRVSVETIRDLAPGVTARYREQLRERIRSAGLPLPPEEDERLLKEVVYFADRSDISEEVTRLQSHFAQFEDCARSKEPVGRTLDFLAQEMNREVNTIGSKANDAAISREVVGMKAELEKFREQVQNVE